MFNFEAKLYHKMSSVDSSPDACKFCPYVSVVDILSWKNPIVTGCLLACINLAFFIIWGFDLSVISLLAILGLIAMGLGFITSLMVYVGR